ncbi:ribonuclease H-like domain-containing protein [Tanacetum coccineum]
MTDLGPLNYFLGISAQRTSSGLFLSRTTYAREVLERVGMLNCNASNIPVATDSKLGLEGNLICLFMHDPRESHFSAPKRILRYVRGTLDHGLQSYTSPSSQLTPYSDADWAGFPTNRRSTSGYCVCLGDNLISWLSRRQHVISRSSAEVEYRGVANDVAKTAWRMKRIEIDIHFVRDIVATGHVHVLHVPSRYQYADIFTKGLPSSLFTEFRSSLNVNSSLAPTAREY